MPDIPYESEKFPLYTVTNGPGVLSASWDEVLWAALTVGRPNRAHVFRHGMASMHEAMFRLSLVRMALEQSGPYGRRFNRTDAFKTLDPTEKGAVNYFLGMTFCKVFAANLLNTPWLLHLDVFRPTLSLVLRGRSRPDLIGEESGGGIWHAFECKGRMSNPDSTAKTNAKKQATRLVSVDRTRCTLHVAGFSYFRGDVLNYYWRDPLPEPGRPIDVPDPDDKWGYYYEPTMQLIASAKQTEQPVGRDGLLYIEGADLGIALHPVVAGYLAELQWARAKVAAMRAAKELAEGEFQPDGIKVVAGRSWKLRFADQGEEG